MLIQQQTIHSLDLSEVDFDTVEDSQPKIGDAGASVDKSEEDGEPEKKQEVKEHQAEKRSKEKELPLTDQPTFDKFLDIMEIF